MEIPTALNSFETAATNSMAALLVATVGVLLTLAWSVLDWVWLRPKKVERQLRRQGFAVRPYRLFHGDLKDVRRMGLEATSTPMPGFSHDYFPRIRPFLHRTITNLGEVCVTWEGPVAVVNVGDAEMVKEAMLKHDEFRKPKSNPLTAMLLRGLVSFDGENCGLTIGNSSTPLFIWRN